HVHGPSALWIQLYQINRRHSRRSTVRATRLRVQPPVSCMHRFFGVEWARTFRSRQPHRAAQKSWRLRMTIPTFLLLSSALLNTEARPVYVNISIGAHGPYRFLFDTEAQTNLIDMALAKELRFEPQFRTEIITQNTSRLSPGLRSSRLRA